MRFKQLAFASALALTALGASASAIDVAVPSSETFAALASKAFNNEYDFSLGSDLTLTTTFTVTPGLSVTEYLYSIDFDTDTITEISFMKLAIGETVLVAPMLAGDYFYKLVGKGTSGGSYTLDLSVIAPAAATVPETGKPALLLAGVAMLGLIARRRTY